MSKTLIAVLLILAIVAAGVGGVYLGQHHPEWKIEVPDFYHHKSSPQPSPKPAPQPVTPPQPAPQPAPQPVTPPPPPSQPAKPPSGPKPAQASFGVFTAHESDVLGMSESVSIGDPYRFVQDLEDSPGIYQYDMTLTSRIQ